MIFLLLFIIYYSLFQLFPRYITYLFIIIMIFLLLFIIYYYLLLFLKKKKIK